MSWWLPAASLWRREMVRFFRQRSRVIGSLAAPLVFWVLFSAGFGPHFRTPAAAGTDVGSFAFFFPGTVTLILLFTSIFTNISVIQDRQGGFLQGVLVSPVPRSAIVLGKVAGGASIAMLQGLAFLGLAALGGVGISLAQPWPALGAMILLALAISGLGFCFAWKLDSIQAFHGIMNLVLMPMWVLSGALFPVEGSPIVLRTLITMNPIHYGLALMRRGLGVAAPGDPSLATAFLVTGSFAVITILAACAIASARGRAARTT